MSLIKNPNSIAQLFWRALILNRETSQLGGLIRKNHFLNEIDLSDLYIGHRDGGSREIATALNNNPFVTVVDLSNNYLNDMNATVFANLLTSNSSLEAIDLGANSIGDVGINAIADMLRSNRTLKRLALRNNSFANVTPIAEALKKDSALQLLYLSGNFGVNDAGATEISDALCTNISLHTLSLGKCNIGNAGVIAIANMLSVNSSLTHLYLFENPLFDAGAIALANALETNNSLIGIDLSNCQIGDAGITAIGNMLSKNTALKVINLGEDTVISDVSAQAIIDSLKTNTSITKIVFNFCVSSDKQREIEAHIKYNKQYGDACDQLRSLESSMIWSARHQQFDAKKIAADLSSCAALIEKLRQPRILAADKIAKLKNEWLLRSLQFLLRSIDPLEINELDELSLMKHPQIEAALSVFNQMQPNDTFYQIARDELTRQLIVSFAQRDPKHLQRALRFFNQTAPQNAALQSDEGAISELARMMAAPVGDAEAQHGDISVAAVHQFNSSIVLGWINDAESVAKKVTQRYKKFIAAEKAAPDFKVKDQAAKRSWISEHAKIALRTLVREAIMQVGNCAAMNAVTKNQIELDTLSAKQTAIRKSKQQLEAQLATLENELTANSKKELHEHKHALSLELKSVSHQEQLIVSRKAAIEANPATAANEEISVRALEQFFTALNEHRVAALSPLAVELQKFPAIDAFVKSDRGEKIIGYRASDMSDFLIGLEHQNELHAVATTTDHPVVIDIFNRSIAFPRIIELAKKGIANYLAMPRTIKNLGFLSATFDNDLGKNRAAFYLDHLSNTDERKQQALTLYALLSSTDGQKLKSAVCAQWGNQDQSELTQKTYQEFFKKFLIAIYQTENPERDLKWVKNKINHDLAALIKSAQEFHGELLANPEQTNNGY